MEPLPLVATLGYVFFFFFYFCIDKFRVFVSAVRNAGPRRSLMSIPLVCSQSDNLTFDVQDGTVLVCSCETLPDHAVLSNFSQR